jgi:major type 1 subunit fimbrin (pilin)
MKTMKLHGKIMAGLCCLLLGNVAFAADNCAPTSGSVAPATGLYDGFNLVYDISALAVGSTIATRTVRAAPDVYISCPSAVGSTVVAGVLTGGGIVTGRPGPFNTLETIVPGVGVRINSAVNPSSTGFKLWPTATAAKAGAVVTTNTITFIKTSSINTGLDSLETFASMQVAVGDNRLIVLDLGLNDGIRFIRGGATTCSASVIPGSAISMPKVQAAALATYGGTAGNTPFSIQLVNCTTSGAVSNGVAVRTYFDGPQVNASTGNLNLGGAATATNVQLQLTNANGSVINLAGAKTAQNVAIQQITSGAANLPYAVRYFATGKSTPGLVASVVNYTIEYP